MNLTNCEKAIKELIFWKSNKKFFKKPLRLYDLPKAVIFLDTSVVQYEQFSRMSEGHIPVIKI